MHRKTSGDDETARRRRAAAAEPERSLALRILFYSPKDVAAGLIALTACSAIIANSLFLQKGPHPAPMFGSAVGPHTGLGLPNPLPRPRPADADVPLEPRLAEPKLSESRLFDPKPEPKPAAPRQAQQRSADPSASPLRETNSALAPANALRPPASIPGQPPLIGSRRVAAVQRALTEYGYGQLKPTGTIGSDTKVAIEKFERERKMPVTGQISERLVHELGAVTGHSLE